MDMITWLLHHSQPTLKGSLMLKNVIVSLDFGNCFLILDMLGGNVHPTDEPVLCFHLDEYKPLLDEIERIQAQAGIEAADVQHRTGPGASGVGQESRHRR